VLLVGFALLAVAGFAYWRARTASAESTTMAITPTLPVAQLEQMRRQIVRPNPRGGFRHVTEVVGAAQPGPDGLLTSELGKTPCVWYSYRIRRHWYYRTREGHYREHWDSVAEGAASTGFALVDNGGWTIGVLPAGARLESVEKPVDSYETDFRPELVDVFGFQMLRHRGTLGFHYEELVIRPGTWLYVLGEARDVDGPLVVAKPEDGSDFVISTRPEDELRGGRTGRHRLLMTGAIAALLTGLGSVGVGVWMAAW
jgi:hypothetical protein